MVGAVRSVPFDRNKELTTQFEFYSGILMQVPGGGSANNYGNVELVCRVALQERVQAVWAGWGHASENPRLPELLERNNIAFLGPSANAMQLLGATVALPSPPRVFALIEARISRLVLLSVTYFVRLLYR